MVQTIITYAAVLAAAVWVTWKILLPKRARAKLAGKDEASKCGSDDCGCS